MLVDEKLSTTIIHTSKDLTKSNYHNIDADELAKGIINKGLKCKYYGAGQIGISSILARSNKDLNKVIKQINFSLSFVRITVLFSYVTNILIEIIYGDMVIISVRVPSSQ